MWFAEKLDLILDALSVKNIELARQMKVDASLISKYRTGHREKPTQDVRMLNLCSAIAEFYIQKMEPSLLPIDLRERITEGDISKEIFENELIRWFDAVEPQVQGRGIRTPNPKVFGEKLSALLDMSGISNVQLARALNVDSSLISLYRNGVRLPPTRDAMIDRICTYLVKQNIDEGRKKTLLEMMSSGAQEIDEATLRRDMADWLRSDTELPIDVSGVESFLEKVDQLESFASGKQVLPMEKIAELAGDGAKSDTFVGNRGMQKAAIRYLYHVASQEKTRSLHHFSDQATEWMVANPQFTAVWASLMVHMLKKGNVFRIIHTVDREEDELFTALENWIPLYMIGEIAPFYFRAGSTGRFRVNHFVAEELALISSYCVAGQEEMAVYRYDVDPMLVALAKEQFDALLPMCGELMKIYKGPQDVERFTIHMNAFWARGGDMTALLPRLSLATLPEKYLRGLLAQANVDAERSTRIIDLHNLQERRMYRQLSVGKLEELAMLETTQSVREKAVNVDIAPGLLDEPLAYSVEAYKAHIENIRQMERDIPNYHFYAMPACPFRNLKVLHKNKEESIVQKFSDPIAAFAFDNPHMLRGIEHFLSAMKKQAMPSE